MRFRRAHRKISMPPASSPGADVSVESPLAGRTPAGGGSFQSGAKPGALTSLRRPDERQEPESDREQSHRENEGEPPWDLASRINVGDPDILSP